MRESEIAHYLPMPDVLFDQLAAGCVGGDFLVRADRAGAELPEHMLMALIRRSFEEVASHGGGRLRVKLQVYPE